MVPPVNLLLLKVRNRQGRRSISPFPSTRSGNGRRRSSLGLGHPPDANSPAEPMRLEPKSGVEDGPRRLLRINIGELHFSHLMSVVTGCGFSMTVNFPSASRVNDLAFLHFG